MGMCRLAGGGEGEKHKAEGGKHLSQGGGDKGDGLPPVRKIVGKKNTIT